MELNQTINTSQSSQETVPREVRIIAMSVMPVIMIISLVGNSLIIWLTVKMKILKGPMSILVINLATCNIIITMIPAAMFTVENGLGAWPFEPLFCRASVGVEYSVLTASNAIMVGIAVERYFAVVMPLKKLIARKTTRWILITGWAAAILNEIGYILLMTLSLPSELSESSKSECHVGWAPSPKGLSGAKLVYFIITFILLVIIPFLVMLGLYSKLIYVTHKTERPGRHTNATKLREKRRKHRMIKMMVVTLILFQICWMPAFIQELLLSAGEEVNLSSNEIQILNLITSIMGYSHSALNSLMYPIFNRQYRVAFKKLFQCFKKGRKISQETRTNGDDHIKNHVNDSNNAESNGAFELS